jgi:hypothetical protein
LGSRRCLTIRSIAYALSSSPAIAAQIMGPHSLLGILSIAREHRRALSANAPVAPTIVALGFDCASIDAARSNAGLNTLLYSASTTPVPDIVAPAATA